MGGPGASVLIPARDEAALLAGLEAWLAPIFRHYPPEMRMAPMRGDLRLWHGQVLARGALGAAWDSFAGEADVLERRPAALSLAALGPQIEEIGPEEISLLQATLDPPPAYRFQIEMMCNRGIDHRLLGMLALEVSASFGGWVDFQGALRPPRGPGAPSLFDKTSPEDELAAIRAYLAQFPGRVIEVPYEIDETRSWIYHVADAEFFRAWLAHPDFHMIK